MTIWQRAWLALRGRGAASDRAAREAARRGVEAGVDGPESSPPSGSAGFVRSPAADEVERLAHVRAPDGPTVAEALGILRRSRGTVREADAVSALLSAGPARALDEQLRLACADILAARGDEAQARELLEGATSTDALMLAAELLASCGQIAGAVGTIERVLAREIDAPGARERHARWMAALGRVAPPPRRLDEVTIVAPAGGASPFRLLREVARGGAGAVYEAQDELLGRRVAFKVYHRRGTDREGVEREARMTVAFAGPGVVRLLDASPQEGWIALEWIARGSIRDVLRSAGAQALLPVERWARPLARALARVHAAGLVHADVKPGNVLLRSPDDPVLADFGIARPCGARSEGGSPGYVSPERLAGDPLDARDDVYAFGRVLEDVRNGLAASAAVAWQGLMVACLGPREGRPADGADLAARLR